MPRWNWSRSDEWLWMLGRGYVWYCPIHRRRDDFYIHRHRWIWTTFTRLIETVYLLIYSPWQRIWPPGSPDGTRRAGLLTALISKVPSALNVEFYGHIIEDHSIRRRLLSAANDVARLAYNQEKQLNTVIDDAEKSIFAISERRVRNDLQPIRRS